MDNKTILNVDLKTSSLSVTCDILEVNLTLYKKEIEEVQLADIDDILEEYGLCQDDEEIEVLNQNYLLK